MSVIPGAIAVPDSTGPTFGLLRELRRGQARKQAASVAFWVYAAALIVACYGGTLVAAAYRALRHPPPATSAAPRLLHATPAVLTAAALLLLLALARDALWRGPVTVPPPTADWLLGTPVSRRRLLRPRFRRSAAAAVLAGAAAGLVPAAALVSLGLGGRDTASVLRLTGAAVLPVALLFAAGTGLAGLVERHRAAGRWVRRATPVALAAAALLAGCAAWAAYGHPPPAVAAVVLWSGPWGWAAQGAVAAAGEAAPGPPLAGTSWPLATGLLGAAALVLLAAADRAAAAVPTAVLRSRARTLGAMSAAALTMNTRGVALAYAGAASPRRAWLRLPPPRRRGLVVAWRDLIALARAPGRLIGAVTLALLAVGLVAAASHGRQVSLVPVGCALTIGYLAAAWLCEGARLDADDPRRSAPLPFRFESLAWRHAAVPVLVLFGTAGVPLVAAGVARGDPWPLALLAVTVPVLVAGALVNVFRADFSADLFTGFETGLGNTAVINVVVWFAWGPVLAVVPMTVLLSGAIRSPGSGSLARVLLLGAALALGLAVYAARRARRLRAW